MSIQVKGVTKVYGEQIAVSDLSFQVDKGEIVGFLGPNGAGKSTTMKIICGSLKPTTGHALICGVDVINNPIEAKKKIGYLQELNALYYDMYIKEYLSFLAQVHKVTNTAKRIKEVIALTGLEIEQRKKIGQLSKGYKQRTGLAAALLHDPQVLILDEPTTGLDPNQIIEIRNVIKEQGLNKTILFSSHILQEVEAICSRLLIINKGKLVADAPLSELQSNDGIHWITVRYKEDVPIEFMQSIEGVTMVEKLANFTFKLQTNEPQVTHKQLFELALQRNYNIVSLHSEDHNLEDMFRLLTSTN